MLPAPRSDWRDQVTAAPIADSPSSSQSQSPDAQGENQGQEVATSVGNAGSCDLWRDPDPGPVTAGTEFCLHHWSNDSIIGRMTWNKGKDSQFLGVVDDPSRKTWACLLAPQNRSGIGAGTLGAQGRMEASEFPEAWKSISIC